MRSYSKAIFLLFSGTIVTETEDTPVIQIRMLYQAVDIYGVNGIFNFKNEFEMYQFLWKEVTIDIFMAFLYYGIICTLIF